MKKIIVLAMHGMPPKDFPRKELGEFFALHEMLAHARSPQKEALEKKFLEQDLRIRKWKRIQENDPFCFASQDLARELSLQTGTEVLLGFNEFCAPTVAEAIDAAASKGADKIVVITPMMVRGGEHAGEEIPQTIENARAKYPKIEIKYAWPFATADVIGFLTAQVDKF